MSESDDDDPFKGIRLHKVTSTPFVGIEQHDETGSDWIQELNSQKKQQRSAMTPFPCSAVYEAIGKRETMEDQHVAIDEWPLQCDQRCSFYAVYDGHGGQEAALLVQQLFHEQLAVKLNALDDITDVEAVEGAMRDTFLEVDEKVLAALGPEGLSIGSTAVVIILIGKRLYVANCGDSEGIMGHSPKEATLHRASEPLSLSFKHKPNGEEEKKRITALGGFIFSGRVFGTLGVSRAFGDGEFKPPQSDQMFVTVEPYVASHELTFKDKFLILACDGLWDCLSHEEAVHFVAKLLSVGRTLHQAAYFLREEALDRNTKDNVTVMVVSLGWAVSVKNLMDLENTPKRLPSSFNKFLSESSASPDAKICSPVSSNRDFFKRGQAHLEPQAEPEAQADAEAEVEVEVEVAKQLANEFEESDTPARPQKAPPPMVNEEEKDAEDEEEEEDEEDISSQQAGSGAIAAPGIGPIPVSIVDSDKYICRCGKSASFPFCDGTHNEVNEADGTNYTPYKASKEELGQDTVYVCACGGSKNRDEGVPFCDGAHNSLSDEEKAARGHPVEGSPAAPVAAVDALAAEDKPARKVSIVAIIAEVDQLEALSGSIASPGVEHVPVSIADSDKYICRCGKSASFPMCDGSHVSVNESEGTNFSPYKASKEELGKDTVYVCACGKSKNRDEGVPFCDGTHNSLTDEEKAARTSKPEENPASVDNSSDKGKDEATDTSSDEWEGDSDSASDEFILKSPGY